MLVRRWELSDGELSEAAPDSRRFDSRAFRVARRTYPSATVFVGRTQACTIFVLRGSCWLRSGGEGNFSPGDILDLDAGEYELKVSGSEDLEICTVWDLRAHMN